MGRSSEEDVVILCGGRGLRLRPVLGRHPKPLAEVYGRPLLDLILECWKNLGYFRFILCIGYRASVFKKHYSQAPGGNTKILLSEESKPLGTGGALWNARKLIRSEHFFVLNGDTFSAIDARKLMVFHKRKKAMVTMALGRADDARDFGSVRLGYGLRVTGYAEKDSDKHPPWVNAGIYAFHKRVFRWKPPSEVFSLEKDFFPFLAHKPQPTLFGWVGEGKFWDIGTPERFKQAARQIESIKSETL